MFTETKEYLLQDGTYFRQARSWIVNPDHPLADEDGRVYVARNDVNVDLSEAQEVPEGTIDSYEAQTLADWDEFVTNAEQSFRDRRQATEAAARASLAAAGLPQEAIDALIRLQTNAPLPD